MAVLARRPPGTVDALEPLTPGQGVRPITVLDLRDTYEVGGPGKTILETYRAVDPARFHLHLGVFATSDENAETPFVAAARRYGMPVHVLRGANQYDPRLIWRLADLVRRLDVDLVHAHEVKSDVIAYLASFLARTPIVTTMHGWIGNSPKQRFMIGLDKRVVRRFDCVISVSEQMTQALHEAGVPPARVRLVHNAIVIERYRRTGSVGFLRELLGGPIEGPVVVSIGRLSREKGHADLIEAVRLAAGSGHHLSLVLAGDGPERASLEAQIDAAGLRAHVHLPGYLDRPERLLEEADLTVLPSHTEGLPNAALESLAMNVPVLATRVGGTPDVITDGETGRLVEAHAPAQMADALVEFMVNPDPWRRMAERGRQLVERQFNFEARTRAVESLYHSLVADARRPRARA